MQRNLNIYSRIMIGFPGLTAPDYLRDLAAKGLRSVALYGENIGDPAQLSELVSSLKTILGPDAIIAIDEEGGPVTRVDYLSGSRFIGNGLLGQIDDLELTNRDGRLIGQMLRDLGINLNLAPVADCNTEPLNPVISIRSFGSDQQHVANHVASFVEGHEATGVGTTLKHFPGHGNVDLDSHAGLPRVAGGLDELRREHFEPFRRGITAGTAAVMLAHLDVGLKQPTSLSKEVVDILRDELEFEGLIITDAMDMGALGSREQMPANSVLALLSGVDIVCMGPRTLESEVEQIVELWSQVNPETRSKNSLDAAGRISAFLDSHQGGAINPVEAPSYELPDLDLGIPSRAQVIRFSNASNPAVGTVPWFEFVPVSAQVESTSEVLELIDGFDGMSVVLTKSVAQLTQLERDIPTESWQTMLIISAEPAPPGFPIQTVCTFGSAQPQSRQLADSIHRIGTQIE